MKRGRKQRRKRLFAGRRSIGVSTINKKRQEGTLLKFLHFRNMEKAMVRPSNDACAIKTKVTLCQYNDLGKPIKSISPGKGTETYQHDEVGSFMHKTDARGTVVNYTYDALNRITAVQFSVSSQDITYTYDSTSVTYGKGRLTGRTDTSGSYTFYYDAQGNMTKEEKTINSVPYTTEYSYNKDNVSTSITYPSGRTINYTLDVTGRIIQVDTTLNGNPKTLASSVTYLPYGGITGLTYGNSLSLIHGYDNQYRTSSIVVGSVLDRTYGYDANGNVTSICVVGSGNRNKVSTSVAFLRIPVHEEQMV